jgi:alginate O-acetyltransferase complex protein AlgI
MNPPGPAGTTHATTMVFASLTFLYIFLPLNLILYYSWNNKTYRNALLTVFSLVFYAWGEPVWICLLVFSATLDYWNALLIERMRGTPWARIGLLSSVILNIGLLIVFKYSAFFYENINWIFGLHLKAPAFSLPIGISFYTFQTVSYVIDVYRGEVQAQRSYMKFLMFVSLYHQLVAGPIVRYAHIAHEIDHRKFDIHDVSEGINRFFIGLFKKIFIANVAGELVAKYMDADAASLTTLGSWFGLLMYSLQIYFDFSGYSDMAIGLGKMFGFHYHENFNYPYVSTSATEFWRRWHISLGTFFRDYIYIPLGGNRRHVVLNLFIVWFLTGLWHGASWNFILWGLYFGLLIWIEKLFLTRLLSRIPKFFSHLYLIFAAMMGWALFYFTDVNRLKNFVNVLFGAAPNPAWNMDALQAIKGNIYWLLFALLFCLPVFPWFQERVRNTMRADKHHYLGLTTVAVNLVVLLVCTALLGGKSYNPFIYYRF